MVKKKLFYNNSDKIRYYGETVNGEPHGYGIAYYRNGNKLYEGYFLNGNMDGKGILYDEDGKTKIYEGEFKNDKFEGNGIKYYKGKKSISGKFSNNAPNGECILYYETGQIQFKGIYKDGEPVYGQKFDKSGVKICEGSYKNYKLNGLGILYYYDIKYEYQKKNKKYEGNFLNGKYDGKGIEYDESEKEIVQGEYKEGKLIKGTYTLNDYNYIKQKGFNYTRVKIVGIGEINRDHTLFSGKGIHYDINGLKIYEGTCSNYSYEKGILYNGYGDKLYEGDFKKNKYSGKGILYFLGRKIYEGEFLDGLYDGEGILYKRDGTKEHEGHFSKGLEHGYGVSYVLYPDGDRGYFKNGFITESFNHS